MSPSRFKLTIAVISHLLKTFTIVSLVVGLSGCNENLKDCNGFWDKTFGREACAVASPSPAKATQTITGLSLPALSVGGKATLAATTNSGLAVSYASQTSSVCTVDGVEVTAIAAGTCTVLANQAGDTTHLAATQVTASTNVSEACLSAPTTGSSGLCPTTAPIPKRQVTLERSTLNVGVTSLDGVLAQSAIDVNIFSAIDSSSLKLGQVFIFGGQGYAITGIFQNEDGTFKVNTRTALIAEIFSDLKFSIKQNALYYDDNGNPILTESKAVQPVTKQISKAKLSRSVMAPTITDIARFGCLVPTRELKAEFEMGDAHKSSYGYSYKIDCSVADLFELSKTGPMAFIRIKTGDEGGFGFSADMEYYYDQQNKDNYAIKSANFGVKDLEISATARDIKKLEKNDFCEIKKGAVECEKEIPMIPFSFVIPTPSGFSIPISGSIGLVVKLTFNGEGKATLSFSKQFTRIEGMRLGVKVAENVPLEQPTPIFTAPKVSLNGSMELEAGAYAGIDVGKGDIALAGVKVKVLGFAEIEGKIGNVASTSCVTMDVGAKAGGTVTVLKLADFWEGWELVNDEIKLSLSGFPNSTPKDCGDIGKTKIEYRFIREEFVTRDDTLSTDEQDSWLVERGQLNGEGVLNKNHEIAIDLSQTSFSKNKPLGFEVLSQTPNTIASVRQEIDALGRILVYVKPVDVDGYNADTLVFDIYAFAKEDRANTESKIKVSLKMQQPLMADPKYWYVTDAEGRTTMYTDVHPTDYTVSTNPTMIIHLKGAGDDIIITPLAKDYKTTKYIAVTPETVSLSNNNKFSYTFRFVEDKNTIAEIDKITPALPKVGDVVTFKIKGRLMQKDFVLDVPQCSNLKLFQPDWASIPIFPTDARIYTCTAQTAGKDLLIKANGQFIGSYSIEDTVNCAQGFELKDSKCVWAGSAIIAPSTSTPTINTPMTFSLQGVLDGVKSVLWTIGDTITHMVTDALDAIFGHPVKVVTNLGDAISNTFTELGNKIAKATLLDAEGKDIANVTPVTVSVGCPSGKIVQDGVCISNTVTSHDLLNDTGITQCTNDNTIFANCSVDNLGGWFGLNQDGEVGRDFSAVNGQLIKVGGGDAGFDFTKINATGEALSASATEWSCVKDNHTGLMWEVKTNDGGLRDTTKRYTWYNPDATTNGGTVGSENGGNNTQAFTQAVNAQGLCGYSDWRLPTKQELHSIVNYGKYNPAIDGVYFPATQNNGYWSSSVVGFGDFAWDVYFGLGYDHYGSKNESFFVRLVRASQ